MSIEVSVTELAETAAAYGPWAYVAVNAAAGPPRITHSAVAVDTDGVMTVSLGRRAAEALAADAVACVLWPATDSQSLSLIVDAELVGAVPDEGGSVRLRATGAVRHRPPGTQPASG